MDILAIKIIVLISFFAFAGKRLMNFLHALQQDDYNNGRLLSWILQHGVFDKRVSAVLLLASIAALLGHVSEFTLHILIFCVFIAATYFEKDARKQSKKALKITKRAQRILLTSLLYSLLCAVAVMQSGLPVLWIVIVQALPLLLVIGNLSLAPYENSVQKKLYAEALQKLADINPTIIAVTGSYGKTSVKHILAHILKVSAPTLVTPGSVNTVMGVTRILREQLAPNHKYFVTEMGAYGPGSIKKLCELTPPNVGIITSIGHAHYERFRSLEAVVQAKYELAESVLSRNGTMIVHEKTLKYEHSRNIRNQAMDHFIACGEPMGTKTPKNEQEYSYLSEDDLKIMSVEQTPKGLCVTIEWKEEKYTLRAPLYGIHHGHNIALAFACAMSLGMEAKDIKTALASTPQIKHRLEVKQQQDGSIIIDDAFNSNPPGFRSALHVLKVLADDRDGRGILVTPGIVELGSAHNEVHKTLGALAAETCHIVLVVNPERIPTFLEGFRSSAKSKILLEFDTFEQAQKWLIENKQSKDVILLENDLPDIYERVLKI